MAPWEATAPAYAQPGGAPAAFVTEGATTPLVSTRGHFNLDTGLLLSPGTPTSYDMTPNVPRLGSGHCTSELVTYVHGFFEYEHDAIRNFNLARQSLAFNGYTHPVVGFTWDSNVVFDNWSTAKAIAEQNGPKLAQFLLDLKLACPGTTVRLVGHSLGARVILTALGSLNGNTDWTDPGFRVASVHVLGAAVLNGEIATDTPPFFGRFVEKEACEFHNKFSPGDDWLETPFFLNESDFALGETGAHLGIRPPSNYHQEDVQLQIIPADTDGDFIPDTGFGDNHLGYAGLIERRGLVDELIDDGAMDRVISDWKRQLFSASCLKNLSANPASSGFQDVAASGDNAYVVWEDKTSGEFDILFRASDDGGATFGTVLNLSRNSGSSRFPEIAAEGQHVYVAWEDSTPGATDIFFAASQDGGETFSPPSNLSDSPQRDINVQIAASAGSAYVTWNTWNVHGTGTGAAPNIFGEVFFRAIASHGTQPGRLINVSETPEGFSDMPHVAASFGSAYVVWTEGNVFGLSDQSDIWGRRILGGEPAGEGENLSEILGSQPSISVSARVAASGDTVYVAWNDDASGAMDTYLRASLDSGARGSFGLPHNVSQTAGNSYGMELAAEGTDAYVVWSDGGGVREVFFRAVRNSGAMLGPSINLSRNPGLSHDPEIAAVGDNVYVGWHDQQTPDNFDTVFRASLDRGHEFIPRLADPPLNLSTNTGDTWATSVAAAGDRFYAAWTDFTPGKADILFRAGNIRELAPFQGTVKLNTPDRGVLPLKRVEVDLINANGQEVAVAFTDDQGRYRMVLPEGVTTGTLRVFLGDEDNFVEVQHESLGDVPAYVNIEPQPPLDLTRVRRGDIVFSATNPKFTLNGARFDPPPSNVARLEDFPHLAGIYYYALTAMDFARGAHLPGLRLDDKLPLEVVGFSLDADNLDGNPDNIGISHFFALPEPTLHIETLAGPADGGGSRLADGRRTEYDLDTLFHEFGHYIHYESAIGGENSSGTKNQDVHAALSFAPACHLGYANVDSSCAWGEGLATFLSSVILDTVLTDAAHQGLRTRANIYMITGGAWWPLEPAGTWSNTVGPKLGAGGIRLWSSLNEEFALSMLLWDLYDDTPTDDTFHLPMGTLWEALTNPQNSTNPEIITTVADLYVVLKNSGLVPEANLNQLFGTFDICVDADRDLACTAADFLYGDSAWTAATVRGGPPVFGYVIRLKVPFIAEQALSVQVRDDLGRPVDEVLMSGTIIFPDGSGYDGEFEMESGSQLVGFYLPHPAHATLTFSKDGYVPAQVDIGSEEYWAGVTDDKPFALEVAVVLIQENSTRPIASSLSGSLNEDTVATLVLSGSDAQGDPLTFAIVEGPLTGQLGAVTPIDQTSASVVYTPPKDFNGAVAFTFKANDGREDSAPATVELAFTPVSDPPVAVSGPDQTVAEGTLVHLDGGESADPDGDELTFAWTQLAGPPVSLSSGNDPQPTFTAPGVTSDNWLSFQLVVSDPSGRTATDAIRVLVQDDSPPDPVNRPPVAIAGPDQTVVERTAVTLDGRGSTDPDGDALTFAWTQVMGPAQSLSGANSATPSLTAPPVKSSFFHLLPGLSVLLAPDINLAFLLEVSDGQGHQAIDFVSVNVRNGPNLAVVANAGPDQVVDEGSLVTLDGRGTFDPDEDAFAFEWSQNDYYRPQVELQHTNPLTPTFVAPMVERDTLLVFYFVANDGFQGIPNSISRVHVTVRNLGPPPNRPPIADAGDDQVVEPDAPVTLSAGAFDPDGDPTAFSWTQIAGPPVTLSAANEAETTFTAPSVPSAMALTFRLDVADGRGGRGTDALNVIVSGPAPPPGSVTLGPVLDLGPDTATAVDDSKVAVDGSNVYVIYRQSSRDLFLRRSTDAGETLGVPFNLTDGGLDFAHGHQIIASGGRVYVSWIRDDQAGGEDSVMLRVSTDGGATFGPTLTLGETREPASMAVSGNDVYVAMTDPSNNIVLAVNHNAEATFSKKMVTSGNSTAPSVGASGPNVYLLWHDFSLTPGPVMYSRSVDGGANFDVPQQVSGTRIAFPQGVVTAGTNIYLIWVEWLIAQDPRFPNPLFLRLSTDGGATLGAVQSLNAPDGAALDGRFLAAGNDLHAIWSEEEEVFYRRSQDGGASLDQTVNLSADLERDTSPADLDGSISPLLAGDGDRVFVLWQTGPSSDEAAQIVTRASDNGGTSFDAPLTLSESPIIDGHPIDALLRSAAAAGDYLFLTWELELTELEHPGRQQYRRADFSTQTANRPPVADAGPDQTVNEGAAVALNGTASSDSDGDQLSFAWTQIAGPAVTITGADTATPAFLSPQVEGVTVLAFQLVVHDGETDSLPDAMTVLVSKQLNRPPVADAGEDQTVDEGSAAPVSLDGSASSDPDGDALTYSWTQVAGAPVSLTGADTAGPSFSVPLVDQDDVLAFQLIASDGRALSPPDVVTIIVRDTSTVPNRAPTADAGPEQSVEPATGVTLNGTASFDPEGNPLTYAWTQLAGPAVALSDASAATPAFTAPSVDADTLLVFQLVVNDGALDSSADGTAVIVRRLPANRPPEADAGPDRTVEEGLPVALDGTGSSDPDGDAISFSWTQTAGPAVMLSDPAAPVPTFTAPQVEADTVLVFQLAVNDGESASHPDVVSVTVLDVPSNSAPLADAGPDQTVVQGSQVALNGSGSSDVEGDPLAYRWTQLSGPEAALSGPDFANPTFTAPHVDADTAVTFQLVVNDGVLDSAPDTVSILVVEAPRPPSNRRPIADAGPDQIIGPGAPATLDGTGSSDPDGGNLGFAWTQVDGPPVLLSDPGAARPTFTAPVISVNTLLTFQLIVSDGDLESDPDGVSVLVVLPSPTHEGDLRLGEAVSNLLLTVGLPEYLADYVGDRAPAFDVPPTPPDGVPLGVAAGQSLTFTVQCSDPDAADSLVLGALALPVGAALSPGIATGNPAETTFNWTPASAQTATVTFLCTDNHGSGVEHSVPIEVTESEGDGRRMTGGGSLRAPGGARVSLGFELLCTPVAGKNNLEVNWGNGNKFHLEVMTTASCTDNPAFGPQPPEAGFDTHQGSGLGRYNGEAGATIQWGFTDAGEPGGKDTVQLLIQDSSGTILLSLSGELQGGNIQAHKE